MSGNKSVYSGTRVGSGNEFLPESLPLHLQPLLDRINESEGRGMLVQIPDTFAPLVFFDPEYRGILEYQNYGNEGKRQKGRADLQQMSHNIIRAFVEEIARILVPKGHLMLWIDKFHLVNGISSWLASLPLQTVDLITWDKGRIGMGYRTRRRAEYLLVIQKLPVRAKGVWTDHKIPDVWPEKQTSSRFKTSHVHAKPIDLQRVLIEATTAPGDLVIDPAAGSYSVMHAAHAAGRHFLGCDISTSL